MPSARHLAGAVLVAALAVCQVCAQAPRFGGVRVELRPNPRVIPADGQSFSTVRAELRDGNNRPVPDGTRVVFRIEGGSLDSGGRLEKNHLYLVTIEGGGLKATASTVKVLARGSYTIT